MVTASNIPKYLYYFFSPCFVVFSWFGNSVPSVMCRFQRFITTMVNFSMPNFILLSCLYVLAVYIRVSNSFSILGNSLMSFMNIKWFIFFCDLLSLYPAAHFLKIWLSHIIAIIDNNGDTASPRNMPRWIFISAKLFTFSSCFLFHFSGFHDFLVKIYDFVGYSIHFDTV